jgi:hypothetical protein
MTELTKLIDSHCTEDTINNSSEHKQLKDKIRKMNGSIHNNSWAQFEEYFNSVHPYFSINLLNENPKLTLDDLRLCYFLRLNMSSKEIAQITNKENHSIDIARCRLRKKFKLDRQCKLNEFLQRF